MTPVSAWATTTGSKLKVDVKCPPHSLYTTSFNRRKRRRTSRCTTSCNRFRVISTGSKLKVYIKYLPLAPYTTSCNRRKQRRTSRCGCVICDLFQYHLMWASSNVKYCGGTIKSYDPPSFVSFILFPPSLLYHHPPLAHREILRPLCGRKLVSWIGVGSSVLWKMASRSSGRRLVTWIGVESSVSRAGGTIRPPLSPRCGIADGKKGGVRLLVATVR